MWGGGCGHGEVCVVRCVWGGVCGKVGVRRLVLVCMWGCGCCEVGVGVVRWAWVW